MTNSPSDRDRSLELWLRRLEPARGAAAGACLDAETAAAWTAGGLTGASLAQAQSHVSDCAPCQAMMAALVRADSGAGSVAPARASRWWQGWLVPLTAAATASIAIAVWVALPRQSGSPVSSLADSVPSSPPVAGGPAAPARMDSLTEAPENKVASPSAAAESVGSVRTAGAPPAAPSLANAEEARSLAPVRRSRIEAAAAPSGAATQGLGATAAADAGGAAAPPSPVVAAAPAVAGSASLAAPVASTAAADAKTSAATGNTASGPIEFASPDRAMRWRLAGALVERSMDAGATWASAATGTAAPFTAGSAPSRTTCWLVGPGGVVLLTTDGVAWHRVPFPDQAPLAAIAATDARTATITTMDGRTYRTTDAGATWSR